jgi:DNA-binding CsgD family transcriptional regulator
VTCLTRRHGDPDFTREEAAFVASVCEHIASGLRTALLLRAVDEAPDQRVPRARLRTRTGRWLLLHGACLRDRDGTTQQTAIMIEPARRAEIASMQVTQLLARGLAIDEIAQTLWLSYHTVRDHIKAIFSKVRVTSRPELTAKLFAEQFLPELETRQPTTT